MKRLTKILIALVFLFICIALVFSYQASVNNISSGNNSQNISITANTNSTVYIDIPLYTYVKNFTINVQGISNV